jgi:hypothetical protein
MRKDTGHPRRQGQGPALPCRLREDPPELLQLLYIMYFTVELIAPLSYVHP